MAEGPAHPRRAKAPGRNRESRSRFLPYGCTRKRGWVVIVKPRLHRRKAFSRRRIHKDLERSAPEGTRAGTVLHAAAGRGLLVPDIFSIEDWHMKNEHGYSVIDLARKGMHLHLVSQYEALVLAEQLADRPAVARISRSAP